MKRQKTFMVDNKKIKIVSALKIGTFPSVKTTINNTNYFSNFEIMNDYKITSGNHKEVYEEFIKRAMDRAYCEWVKVQK